MKLSDIKGERCFDVIAAIIEPVANIAEDKEATAIFKRVELPNGEDASEFTKKRLIKGVPVLLKSHKSDLIAILAAIKGVDEKIYAESLNLATLTSDVVELLTDKEFMSLFS